MIRYVIAAILTVALLVVAVPAIDRGATMNTERAVDSNIAAVDDAATSLAETEEVSPEGHPDPQRVVELSLPERSPTTAGVDHFEIVPNESADFSAVRYVLEDGTTRTAVIDERIVRHDPDGNAPIEVGGTGEVRLRLTLQADGEGRPVVVADRL